MKRFIEPNFLPINFYTQNDVVTISKNLLGKWLFTCFDNVVTGGMIIETEAYAGATDRACHAYCNRRTKRTEVMFQQGGIAYVYLCYGIHSLLNVVTNIEEIPHAVLIRSIFPTHGIEAMLSRRGKIILDPALTSGPGALTQALGVTLKNNAQSFLSSSLWIEDRFVQISEQQIIAGPRIGVEYAKEDAQLPWRFRIERSTALAFQKSSKKSST
jgi:DNA-3-methyladenine glycosylase